MEFIPVVADCRSQRISHPHHFWGTSDPFAFSRDSQIHSASNRRGFKLMSATRLTHAVCVAILISVAEGCEPQAQTALPSILPKEPARVIAADSGLEFPDGRTLDLGSGWENAEVHCQGELLKELAVFRVCS